MVIKEFTKVILIMQINRLKDFLEPTVIIKYDNNIIGKIPLIALTYFDIYDTIKTFDNIITFPKDLVDVKYLILFINNIFDIISKNIEIEYETIANIIIILDYLQFDPKKFKKFINKALNGLTYCEHISIQSTVLSKINRLFMDINDVFVDKDTFSNAMNIFFMLENQTNHNLNDCPNSSLYDQIKKYIFATSIWDDNVDNFDNFIKCLCKNKCPNRFNIDYQDVESFSGYEIKKDWKDKNLVSSISNMYSFNMLYVKEHMLNKEMFYLKKSKFERNNRITITNTNEKRTFYHKKSIAYLKNIDTNEKIFIPTTFYYDIRYIPLYDPYYIIIEKKKYYTDKWFLVIDLY